jgi:hypothetical protein
MSTDLDATQVVGEDLMVWSPNEVVSQHRRALIENG